MGWELLPRWPIGHLSHIGYRGPFRRRTQRTLALVLTCVLVVAVILAISLPVINAAFASPARFGIAANASCGQLANADYTATNGGDWGRTILAGHNAPGGWFGVDVCSNGTNTAAPNGSNVSCDRVPSNWNASGCAPGQPSNDGYGWTFQCVELILRFAAWAFGDNPGAWGHQGGNAPDIWLPVNHPSDYIMYPNGSATAPVAGDILVWGSVDGNGNPWPAGPDGQHGGHIGVVAAVHNGVVTTAEQNVKWGSQDHPSDTLALTSVGGRWILSGSTAHETTLPTYRWLRTMGRSRATYGWLHSTKNNGVFPSTGGSGSVRVTPGPTKTPSTQNPGGLPALTPAIVVSASGALADLVWSTPAYFADPANSAGATSSQAQAQATLRSLGAPPGVRLRSAQTAASASLANGVRYTYAIGTDGQLYAAQTSPSTLGVFWAALGAPTGVQLVGSPAASLIGAGVVVAALGSDGQLWLRRGAPDTLGAWEALGHPTATTLAGGFAVAGAPGLGDPLLLTIGANGALYERLWQEATLNADGSVAIPATWSDWTAIALPTKSDGAAPQLVGALIAAAETPSAEHFLGSWPDTPLDLFALDANGALWRLRSTSATQPWAISQITQTSGAATAKTPQLTMLLGGAAIADPATTSQTGGSTVTTNTTGAQASPATTTGATTSATATTTASPAKTPPEPTALHIYATTAMGAYLIAIPPAPSKGTPKSPTWTALAATPATGVTQVMGAALQLAPGLSGLVMAQGDQAFVGGVTDATALLLPNGAAAQPSATSATPAWYSLGHVAPPVSFADSFTGLALDSRWTPTDPAARTAASKRGLVLTPSASSAQGASDMAALTQLGQPGDGAVSARVTPGKTGAAGLVMYLDANDWVTLLANDNGNVTFCAMAWQQEAPCAKQTAALATDGSLWLRITRVGAAYTASASADGQTWATVGVWTPTWPGAIKHHTSSANATPTKTVHAAPAKPVSLVADSPDGSIAPLAFTSCGVMVAGTGASSDGATFASFAATVA